MRVLLTGAAIILAGLYLFGRPTPPAEPIDAEAQARSLAAYERRLESKRAEDASRRAKIDPVVARLESEGISRDELIAYFKEEVTDTIDEDDFCSEHTTN